MQKYKKGTVIEVHREFSFFVRILIFAVVAFAVVTIVYLQFQANALEAKRDELRSEVNDLYDKKEQLENEYSSMEKDENVIAVAKDKLNLRLPEEIIFYNDLYN